MFVRNNNRLKRMTSLAILLALVVPVLVTATVVISNQYSLTASSTNPDIFLAEGPNYGAANQLGLLIPPTTLTVEGQQYIPSGSVTVNTVTGSSDVYLLNVLEVYNTTFTGDYPVSLTISGTLPTGVTLYYATSPMTFSGSSITGGTEWTSGTPSISITSTGTVLYFSFALSGSVSGTTTLTFQFTVG